MAEMWNVAGKIKVFHKKAYFFVVGQVLFKKNILLSVSYLSVYLLYCESACRERMMQEISIPKQQ